MSSYIKQNISNSLFWDDLYKNNKDKWNLKSVTPAFVDWEKENHKDGNINVCVPGCGKGSDALYFASFGYNVHAIDFSKYAVNYLRKKFLTKFTQKFTPIGSRSSLKSYFVVCK